jgi:glycine/D-amino acid oxidase-like deaminating enzyme
MSSVAVIGGGIVGMSCALRIAQAGHAVILIDPREGMPASWGNAGHIATEQVAPLASPRILLSFARRLFAFGGPLALPPRMIPHWAPFAVRLVAASTPSRFRHGQRALEALVAQAAPAWQRLATELGDPSLVHFDGHFVAWESGRTAAAGKRSWTEAGTGSASFRDASPDELDALRQVSPRLDSALRFEGTGQVADLEDLARSLERALYLRGVPIHRGQARMELDRDGRARVPGVMSDQVVVTAGVGSRSLMRAAGHRVPLIAERGYHIRSTDFDWDEHLSPLVFEDRGLIVTRFRHCAQVSSFAEFGKPDAPPDRRKWQRLERHIEQLRLPLRPPFARWMGSRPTLPDYLPAIGRSRRASNLFYAFGHQHLGLTLAPITGELVEALISGRTPSIDVAPFDVERFERRPPLSPESDIV